MNQEFFDKRIRPILTYIGIIGAVLMAIAYVIIVFVLINGFQVEEILTTTVFAVVNASVGFVIMQFLKIQGVDFAKQLPENQEVLRQYYNTKTKDKKSHSIAYFWVTSVIKDVFMKCLTLGATTVGVIYIIIEGSHDYNLLALAVVNLIMFLCFGLLSLVGAYDYYNNMHIPYLKEKLKEITVC